MRNILNKNRYLFILYLLFIIVVFTACQINNKATSKDMVINSNKPEESSLTVQTEQQAYNNITYKLETGSLVIDEEKLKIEIKYPIIIGMENDALQKLANALISQRVEDYKQFYYKEDDLFTQTVYTNYEITKQGGSILSFTFFISFYMEGAAHPNNFIDGVTIDLKTGKEINFEDLFNEGSEYKSVINEILNNKLKQLNLELLDEFKGLDDNQGFYLNEKGLVLYYQTYVYTPHAYGPLLLEIGCEELDIIRETVLSDFLIIK